MLNTHKEQLLAVNKHNELLAVELTVTVVKLLKAISSLHTDAEVMHVATTIKNRAAYLHTLSVSLTPGSVQEDSVLTDYDATNIHY